jgi:hypothetical protein
MGQEYVELYRKLDTKDDENDIYKMAKLRERKTRDFNQVKYIKDDEIKNRWREYFDKLFNEESEKSLLSWMTHLLTPTDDLFGEFKSLR